MSGDEKAPSLFCCALCGQFRRGADAGQRGGMTDPRSGQAISSWICSGCVAASVLGSGEDKK